MIVGIDPGISGALAFVDKTDAGISVRLADIPIITMPGKKARNRVNGVQLTSLLMGQMPTMAYLENVHAMPKDGGVQAFNFGRSFGVIVGVLEALQIPYKLVEPVVWKRWNRLIGSNKDAARGLATQLYPAAGEDLSLKKHVGRADALLIAHYGLRTEERAAA